jgi:uncharacterized protein (DUF1684 family)
MRLAVFFAAAGLLAAAYVDDAAKWRADYEASLKAPTGWLSVAGLFWLHEGSNSVGSDPHSDVVLPSTAPQHAGSLEFHNGKVTWEKRLLASDAAPHPDVLKIGALELTIIERGGKTGARLRDPDAATRRNFKGNEWFPISTAWRIQAKWIPYAQPKKIPITNILGMTDEEPVPGVAEFTVQGKTLRLEPVIDDGELFFMFRDATTGKSTYPAGRFLYAELPKPGASTVELDFNRTHNPPCAFTAFATCPLPPRRNTLPIAVEAGEKKYGHD